MPVLIYQDSNGREQEKLFLDSIRIGSESKNDLVLPSEAGVLPEHAVIIRSVVNRLHMLVNMPGSQTRVNGKEVISIQVLRQRDELQLGQLRLKLWELRLASLSQRDRSVGRISCPICTETFKAGDVVFFCPRCETPHHRDCWFSLITCGNYTCEYPVQAQVMDALSPWVKFEHYQDRGTDIIEVKADRTVVIRSGQMMCQANNIADQVAFQPGDVIAYCPSPSCQSPFHLECWLMLPACTQCQYDNQELIDQVFSSGHDGDDGDVQPGGPHAG